MQQPQQSSLRNEARAAARHCVLKITVVMLDFFQEDSIEILYIGSMG